MSGSWHGIDAFVAVASTGSFTGAAQMLGVPTSTISRAVAKLETQTHTALFYRTTRRVVLTDTGRVFVEHCRRMIAERDEAFAALNASGDPSGELRITCSTTMGERFIAPIIQAFCVDYPDLNVTIDLNNRVVDILAEGYDMAIRTGIMADSNLIRTKIATRRSYTCAAPDYLQRAGTPQTVADLKTHDCLVGSSANWQFQVGDHSPIFEPSGRFRCNSGETIVNAAIAGLGICQLPEFYVLRHLSSGALVEILKDHRPQPEPIWAVYPQRRHLTPKVRLLVERLRSLLEPALTRS